MQDNPFKIKKNTIKDRNLSRFNADRNEGDNLLFLPSLSGWLGKSLKSKNITFFYAFLILLFLLLISRVTYLQILTGSRYFAIAESNRLKTVELKAPRGIIYDRYGNPLVQNVPRFTVYLNPKFIQNDEQAEELAQYLRERFPEKNEEIDSFSESYRYLDREVRLVDDLEYDLALELMIKSSQIAAIQISHEPRRHYIHDYGLAHVLGYVGQISEEELEATADYDINDSIGKNGIEKQYETILRGSDGSTIIEVDALGREKDDIAHTAAGRGSDLQLTLDLEMQKKLYSVLAKYTDQYSRPAAAGIIIDPNNGEILAMTSYPSYDPNTFSYALDQEKYQELINDTRKPFFSRAISGEYPAGSIFKMSVAAAALEEDMISENFSVNSTGGIFLGDRFFPDWKAGGHGRTNVYKAISDSVNTFFYIIGGGFENTPGLGVDTIIDYARKLGFGQATEIDLPGEANGFLPTREWKEDTGERWYQGDTYNLSIGQGSLLVTPIQIAQYTSYFANSGTFIKPHVLQEYYIPDDSIVSYDTITNTSKPISANTIDIIRAGLRRTVTYGTATIFNSLPVQAAGKTGTAQFNNNKSPHSWFSVFAPYSNPEIVISIIIEEGGDDSLALRAAYEYLTWYYGEYSA